MKGWFDAFRNDGGPTLYSYSNRTPVTGDVHTITLYIIFFTIFIAFLVIFPGVRKERFTTFTSVTLSLFVGTVILVTKYGSGWHVASTEIVSSYRAFSREKIMAELGTYIGLSHANVTLKAAALYNQTEDIDFNERFYWLGGAEIQESYREALVRGLPYPILTVAEYLSLDEEGFSWGRHYRAAGYYGSILLWAAFATWLLMNLLLVVVPRYGAYTMVLTGALLVFTNLVYYWLLPPIPLIVRFEDCALEFSFGWCYWLVLVAGALCILVGLSIAVIDLVFPHKFSTILEVDYDTPYDRHMIIEESHDTRNKKKSKPGLEDPPNAGLGSRILRRLSKRERFLERHGLDNDGFEMDPPKSPWRYPHLLHRGLERTDRKGHKTVSFRRQSRPEQAVLPNLQRSTSQDSTSSSSSGEVMQEPIQEVRHSSSGSSASSLGLSFLMRGGRPAPDPQVTVHVDPSRKLTRSSSPSVV